MPAILKHIHGDRLNVIEKQLEEMKDDISIVSVTMYSHHWYIHYVVNKKHEEVVEVIENLDAPSKKNKGRK